MPSRRAPDIPGPSSDLGRRRSLLGLVAGLLLGSKTLKREMREHKDGVEIMLTKIKLRMVMSFVVGWYVFKAVLIMSGT